MKQHKTALVIVTVFLAASLGEMFAQQPPPGIREIPPATSAASTDEANWWEELRQAANEVHEKRESRKAKETFMELLMKGQQLNYGAPVPDRRVIPLRRFEPQYTEAARRDRVRGRVFLKVECRADGFVGEVEIVKSLRSDMDNEAVQAARRMVFLPAVKDRKFVTSSVSMEMGFDLY